MFTRGDEAVLAFPLIGLCLLIPLALNRAKPLRALAEAAGLLGLFTLYWRTMGGVGSVSDLEWALSLPLPFAVYGAMRLAPWQVAALRRAAFFCRLFAFLCGLQLLFGMAYYMIYRYDNSSFLMLMPDSGQRRAALVRAALDEQLQWHRKLVFARAALDALRMGAPVREPVLRGASYTAKGAARPFLVTTYADLSSRGGISIFVHQLVFAFPFGEMIEVEPLGETPGPSLGAAVRGVGGAQSAQEAIAGVAALAAAYEHRAATGNERVRQIDAAGTRPAPLDFVLSSLNTANLLGQQVAVAAVPATKLLSALQALLTAGVGLAWLNLYTDRIRADRKDGDGA